MFVGREAFEGLEALGEIVGVQEAGEVSFELVAGLVVVASDRRLLDRAVHAFDLAVSPGMVRLGQAVFDAVLAAAHVEHVGHVLRGWPAALAGLIAELHAIVGEHGVDLVRDGGDQGFEKVRCRLAVGCIVKSGKGELGRAIHGHEQMQLAFLGVTSAMSRWK